MKKLFYLSLGVLGLFFSCKTEYPTDYVILSGSINKPNSSSIYIQDGLGKELYKIELDEDNNFIDTIKLATGLYMLYDGKESKELFLKPGYNLDIFIDTKEFDESITYKGKGANENNYLAQKYLVSEKFGGLQYSAVSLPEDRFVTIIDSLTEIEFTNFNQQIELDEAFLYFERNNLDYKKLYYLSNYENSHRYSTNDLEFKVSESYPKTFENLSLDNDSLLSIPFYVFCLDSYIEKYLTEMYQENDTLDFVLASIDIIEERIPNKKIQEQLVYNTSMWALNDTKNLDEAYLKINSIVEKPEYKKEIDQLYETLKKTAKGQPSPLFIFEDINGKEVSLASLKGSVVYIDIWATWCSPCIEEIPSLKKLSSKLVEQNIKFISICTSDRKESWEKMVKEKELSGIQLFAPNDKDDFFTSYVLQGIPRFIIIDKEGNIVDANAIRPSNPNLKTLLEKLV